MELQLYILALFYTQKRKRRQSDWQLLVFTGDVEACPTKHISIEFEFDENSKHSSVKYTRSITTISCTRHDSVTVVTCAKYRCDRLNIFETRAFWIFIEFRIRSKYAQWDERQQGSHQRSRWRPRRFSLQCGCAAMITSVTWDILPGSPPDNIQPRQLMVRWRVHAMLANALVSSHLQSPCWPNLQGIHGVGIVMTSWCYHLCFLNVLGQLLHNVMEMMS